MMTSPANTGQRPELISAPDLPALQDELATWSSSRVSEEPVAAFAVAETAIATAQHQAGLLANAHLVRGMASFQLDRMPLAYNDALRAAELAEQVADTPCRLKARNLMATSSMMMGEVNRAETILLDGLPNARAFGDDKIVCLYLGNLAGIAVTQTRVFEAIEILRELQEITERNGWIDDWLRTTNNLATSYLALRDAESAALACREALTKFDQHPDMTTTRAYLLHSLGCAMEQLGELQKSLAFHEQAVAVGTGFHDLGITSSARLDAARMSRRLGETGRAREHYQRLLDHTREPEDVEPDSTEYRALATAGLEAVSGRFTHDTAARLRALIDRGLPPDREQRRYVYDALAETLVGLGETNAAVSLLQESLAFRDNLWTETLQIHAYSTAQAIQIQEARRQAEEERWRREELSSTIAQVGRLNAENEALVRQLRQQTILLERLSREDSLTGLLNRRAFDERLALELAEAGALGIPVTTCFVDLDNFKHINDKHSHAIGDTVLQTVARLLAHSVSEGGAVGRYGGEEFVLVLPGVESAEAQAIGERMLEAINQFAWETIAPGLAVTLCIGIWTATGEVSPASMISRADHLLYDAKRAGKNQIQVGSA